LYKFAPSSAQCPDYKENDFGVFKCKKFVNMYLETNRCRWEKEVVPTARNIPPRAKPTPINSLTLGKVKIFRQTICFQI
jgi:hypothetical protein